MRAVLWDGNKQLAGVLHLREEGISFELLDFEKTDLNFSLEYAEIIKVKHHNIYDLAIGGLEIISKGGRKNVFIVEDTIGLGKELHNLINRRTL